MKGYEVGMKYLRQIESCTNLILPLPPPAGDKYSSDYQRESVISASSAFYFRCSAINCQRSVNNINFDKI